MTLWCLLAAICVVAASGTPGNSTAAPDSSDTAAASSASADTVRHAAQPEAPPSEAAAAATTPEKKETLFRGDTAKAAVSSRSHRVMVTTATALRNALESKLPSFVQRLHPPQLPVGKLLILAGSVFLIILTISFYQSRRDRDRFMTTTRLSIMDKEVQRACRHIEEQFMDPQLDLRKLCESLVTGAAFLDALFVKELGLSVEGFIDQVRINRAKITLRNEPGIPESALGAAVGFADEKKFTEKFETITGCSVAADRKSVV